MSSRSDRGLFTPTRDSMGVQSKYAILGEDYVVPFTQNEQELHQTNDTIGNSKELVESEVLARCCSDCFSRSRGGGNVTLRQVFAGFVVVFVVLLSLCLFVFLNHQTTTQRFQSLQNQIDSQERTISSLQREKDGELSVLRQQVQDLQDKTDSQARQLTILQQAANDAKVSKAQQQWLDSYQTPQEEYDDENDDDKIIGDDDDEDSEDSGSSLWRQGQLSSAFGLQRWDKPNGDNDPDDDDDDDLEINALEDEGQGHRSKRNAGNEDENGGGKKNKKKHKKRGAGKGGKSCKKVHQCLGDKSGGKKPNKPCAKILDCITDNTTPPAAAPFIPKAVHFMTDFNTNEDVRKLRFGKEAPLNFMEPADWMKDMYKDQSLQPIQSNGDKGFTVNQSGLYLIYSSVMFHDIKPRQSSAVVVNGIKLFKCMDSVDYIDTDLPAGNNQAKYKTCAMTGVTHLKQGDRLEVQNLYANTEIDLSTDATYFGAVLLNPGDPKKEKPSS